MMGSSEIIKQSRFDSKDTYGSDSLNFKMFVGTWNVGGKSPPEDLNLRDWLQFSASPADIYVIGFQEIVSLNAGNVLGVESNAPISKWLTLIREALNDKREDQNIFRNTNNKTSCVSHVDRLKIHRSTSFLSSICKDDGVNTNNRKKLNSCSISKCKISPRYCLAASKQMVGIFLCVWVRIGLYHHINNLKVSRVGTGLMGYMGNKGSISISMTLYKTSFCFVCTHLASGEKERDEARRNSDVVEILKRTRFSHSLSEFDNLGSPAQYILDHDNIIWLGDLNYRLNPDDGDTFELLKNNDWQALLEKDQLLIEQKAGRIFEGWQEGKICFAPTYKYFVNSDHYVTQNIQIKGKQRNPAWCDRILWKGDDMKQMYYERGESKFSDHRPVSSMFSLKIDIKNSKQVFKSNIFPTHASSW